MAVRQDWVGAERPPPSLGEESGGNRFPVPLSASNRKTFPC